MLLAFFFAHLCLLTTSAEEARSLTTSSFKELVSGGSSFILFFSPRCGHCTAMKPEWDRLATKWNADENRPVTIAKVDCTVETELCAQTRITGYPTMILYSQSSPQGFIRYQGLRTVENFESFLTEQLNPNLAPNIPEPKHGLYELTDSTFHEHIKTGDHFVKFYAPWCGHCQMLAPAWQDLAETFSHDDDVTVAKVDCTANTKVCQELDIKGYPTLIFFKDGTAIEKYNGERTHQALKYYVSSMKGAGSGSNLQKADARADAERIPDETRFHHVQLDESGEPVPAVLELTSGTFKDVIANGVTFVKFYAPWCGHCKKLAPTWDDLSKKFSGNPLIKIAKVDCTVHDDVCSRYEVRGFPTLVAFRNGGKVGDYRGKRTLEDLYVFITEYIGHEEL